MSQHFREEGLPSNQIDMIGNQLNKNGNREQGAGTHVDLVKVRQEKQSGLEPLQCSPGTVTIVVFPSEFNKDMLDIRKARERWNGWGAHWHRWAQIEWQIRWNQQVHAALICVRRWQRQHWERDIRWFPVQIAINTWRDSTDSMPGLEDTSASEVDHRLNPSSSSESSDSEVVQSAEEYHELIRMIVDA